MSDPVPSKEEVPDLPSELRRFAKGCESGYWTGVFIEAAQELDRLQRPAHEREGPHCSSCSCGMTAPEPRERASVFVSATSDTEMFAVTAGQVSHYEQPVAEPWNSPQGGSAISCDPRELSIRMRFEREQEYQQMCALIEGAAQPPSDECPEGACGLPSCPACFPPRAG